MSVIDQFVWWVIGVIGFSFTAMWGTVQSWPVALLIPLFVLVVVLAAITIKYSPSSNKQKERRREIISGARKLHSELTHKVLLTNTEPIPKCSLLSLYRDSSPSWHLIKRYLPDDTIKDIPALPSHATPDDHVRMAAIWLRWLTLTVDELEEKWKLAEQG